MAKDFKNTTGVVKYAVARKSDNSVFHVGEVGLNNQISTGLDFLEIYDTKEEIIDIYGELAENKFIENFSD
jgi:hypothetical protein